MQLLISDYAQNSIAQAAADLQARLESETGYCYSVQQIEAILLSCLDSLIEDWASDAYEHCTRPAPHGYSQTEFERLLRRLPTQPQCN
jgi:hypothetical protein